MTLEEKQKRIKDLGETIAIAIQAVQPTGTRSKIDEEQARMEYRLMMLRKKFQDEEASIKIETMEAIYKILTTKK